MATTFPNEPASLSSPVNPPDPDPMNHLVVALEQEAKAVFNISAQEYLLNLQRYLSGVIIRRPKQIYADVNDHVELDSSDGIVWVVVVPIIYFLSVGLLLACILGYFWFIDSAKELVENSEMSTPGFASRQGGSRRGRGSKRLVCSVGNASDDTHQTEVKKVAELDLSTSLDVPSMSYFGQKDGSGLNSIRRSQRSKELSEKIQVESTDRLYEELNSGAVVVPSTTFERTSASWRSFRRNSMTSLRRVLTSCNSSMSPESGGDKSRESLRMSSEYHKLMWSNGTDLLPDMLYGTDDEHPDGKKIEKDQVNNEPAPKKLVTSSRGVHTSARKPPKSGNPNIMVTISNGQSGDDNVDTWSQSTPSITDLKEFQFMDDTVHVYVNPLFATELSDEMHPDQRRESYKQPQSQHEDSSGYLNIEPGADWQGGHLSARSRPESRSDKRGQSGDVGEFHLRDMTPLDLNETSSLSDNMAVGVSVIGSQSTAGSGDLWPSQSDVSDNNSLPSSISRFHANHGPDLPKSKYPFTETDNWKGQKDYSSANAQDARYIPDSLGDNTSTRPRLGSLTQSVPSEDPLSGDDSLDMVGNQSVTENNEGISNSKVVEFLNNGMFFETYPLMRNKLLGFPVGARHSFNSRRDLRYAQFAADERFGDDIDAWAWQPTRRHSLDLLQSERISSEERLTEYGFIRPGTLRDNYVINPTPGKFFKRGERIESDQNIEDSDVNNWTQSSSLGLEHLTVDSSKLEKQFGQNFQSRNQSSYDGFLRAARPGIPRVLVSSKQELNSIKTETRGNQKSYPLSAKYPEVFKAPYEHKGSTYINYDEGINPQDEDFNTEEQLVARVPLKQKQNDTNNNEAGYYNPYKTDALCSSKCDLHLLARARQVDERQCMSDSEGGKKHGLQDLMKKLFNQNNEIIPISPHEASPNQLKPKGRKQDGSRFTFNTADEMMNQCPDTDSSRNQYDPYKQGQGDRGVSRGGIRRQTSGLPRPKQGPKKRLQYSQEEDNGQNARQSHLANGKFDKTTYSQRQIGRPKQSARRTQGAGHSRIPAKASDHSRFLNKSQNIFDGRGDGSQDDTRPAVDANIDKVVDVKDRLKMWESTVSTHIESQGRNQPPNPHPDSDGDHAHANRRLLQPRSKMAAKKQDNSFDNPALEQY